MCSEVSKAHEFAALCFAMQRLLLLRWHMFLHLPRQRPSWYRERLREELLERREAPTSLQKLSETADVFYVLSRAMHDGYPLQSVPPFKPIRHILIYAYMVSKYTSTWLFYRVAAEVPVLCRLQNNGRRVLVLLFPPVPMCIIICSTYPPVVASILPVNATSVRSSWDPTTRAIVICCANARATVSASYVVGNPALTQ